MIKISIITATYNSAGTVRDTFESVLKQGYKDIEYIVVDGASEDQTISIIKEYEPKFISKMKWESAPDKGIYDAMNKGISMATGDVVGILNSDDFYAVDNVLERVVNAFLKDGDKLDAVYGDVDYVNLYDTRKIVRHYSSKIFSRGIMRMGFIPAHPSFYCRRRVYEKFKLDGTKIYGFKGDPTRAYFNTTYKIAADFENLLRMIFLGKIQTKYLPFTFVKMREGGASSSGMESHKQIFIEHKRAFKENGVYSNILFVGLRYCYKIGEVLAIKFKS